LDHAEHKKEVSCSIQDFLNKQNGFTKSHISQLHINNPVRYWQSYFDSTNHDELARLAARIFGTIANSVASERAFSAMNLIVTKLRNRLSPEKANKLIFIYMNQRVLDRSGDLLLGDWVDKTDDEQLDLEELLQSIENEDQDQGQDEDQDEDQDELDIERQLLE
jgi:hAT family C-terminal dimerisation region